MINVKRLFRIKHNLNDIQLCFTEGSHLVVSQEPVKTVAKHHFVEPSFTDYLSAQNSDFCVNLANKPSYTHQRNKFIEHFLRNQIEVSLYRAIRDADELTKQAWLTFMYEADPEMKQRLGTNLSEVSKNDQFDELLKQIDVYTYVGWIQRIGNQAMLAYMGRRLFGFDPKRDEYTTKFTVLCKWHVTKLGAENLLQNTDAFPSLQSNYDLTEIHERHNSLLRYCQAIESGNFQLIEEIIRDFCDATEDNHQLAKKFF